MPIPFGQPLWNMGGGQPSPVAPPQPGQNPNITSALAPFAPEAEQWIMRRLRLGENLYGQQPHRVHSGAGGAAAWGLADAVKQITGAMLLRSGYQGADELAGQRMQGRQKLFDMVNEDPAAGVPENLKSPDADQSNALRRRSMATQLAMSGDPSLQKAGETMLHQDQLDREYQVLAEQINHHKAQLDLERRRVTESEKTGGVERQAKVAGMHDWETKYEKDLGGYITSSKHTGESWLQREDGSPPTMIFPGRDPATGRTLQTGAPAPSGGGAPAPAGGGAPGPGPGASNQPPGMPVPKGGAYVPLNEGQARTAIGATAGVTGLGDALAAGFPTTSTLKSIPEALSWKAAEHGFPQLAGADDQQRVGAWDAVFDPVARERAGLRIPEEQMSRMRMELRPQPGEAWDVHVDKARRIINTFRAAASTLPPVKSRPILAELDAIEAQLPKTKQEYDAFNKNAAAAMHSRRKGQQAPMSVSIPRTAGSSLRRRQPGADATKRADSYYEGAAP